MSATEVVDMPTPLEIFPPADTMENAPRKPKAARMNVTAIPFLLEETESIGDMFVPEDAPTNDWKDPADFIEAVFYNEHNSTIYKMFMDGTWESHGVERHLLSK